MATYGPVPLPSFLNSDATFRAWGSGIAAALAAVGLVKTADTGQINWATVTMPVGVSTAAGYEIYRLNDALQATVPYFFKVEYGTGTVVDRPAVWLTSGSATNGAGTLTGQVGSRRLATPSASGSTRTGATLPLFASGDGSRFALTFSQDPAASSAAWLIAERTRDNTGAYTGDGLAQIVLGLGTAAGAFFGTIPASGTVTDAAAAIPVQPATTTAGSNVHTTGSSTALGTILYFIGKPFYGLSVVEVVRPDVGTVWAATWTATVLGAVHTFLSLSCPVPDVTGTSNALIVFWGLLWE